MPAHSCGTAVTRNTPVTPKPAAINAPPSAGPTIDPARPAACAQLTPVARTCDGYVIDASALSPL